MGDSIGKPLPARDARGRRRRARGRILGEQDVRYCFTVNGGHIWPILSHLREHGVQMIHMRHEQSCAYAADAYARTTGTPGVLAVTAGCGLTNAVTGLCVAGLVGSPVVCLAGPASDHRGLPRLVPGGLRLGHLPQLLEVHQARARLVDDRGRPPHGVPRGDEPAARARPARDSRPTSSTSRTTSPGSAAAPASTRPTRCAAPATRRRSTACSRRWRAPSDRSSSPATACSGPTPRASCAPSPSALQIPVYTRRAAQGAVPEDEPLAVRGAWKKPFTGRADLVIAVGFRFWSGEHFGEPPTWNADATYVQIDATPSRVGWHVPADIPVVGDPKLVLAQLDARAAALGLDGARRRGGSWLAEVARVRDEFDRALRAQEAEVHDARPIHPARVVRDLLEVMDRDATIVVDSFTLSGWLSQWLAATFPGQVVDAGPLAPVGHGIGMGIGAQLARPGKQVIVVIGDGGLGIGGMDIETALKHRLPMCTLVWNNSSWGPSFDQMPMLRGRVDPFDMLPDLRYDRMFEAIGCHGEHVAAPDDVRPALERALACGEAVGRQHARGSAGRPRAARREPARLDEVEPTDSGRGRSAVPLTATVPRLASRRGTRTCGRVREPMHRGVRAPAAGRGTARTRTPHPSIPTRITVHAHEREGSPAERAVDDGEAGLVAERLDDQDHVGIGEVDAGVWPRASRARQTVVAELALDGGRVEPALQPASLEADEEGATGEAVEEAARPPSPALAPGRRARSGRCASIGMTRASAVGSRRSVASASPHAVEEGAQVVDAGR